MSAWTDAGEWLDTDTAAKLLRLPSSVTNDPLPPSVDLSPGRDREIQRFVSEVDSRNARFFEDEVLKLDRWSDDLKQGLEREIQEVDRQIRETKKLAALASTLAEKLDHQRAVKTLETSRSQKRRSLFESQDNIELRRDGLIERTERQLTQKRTLTPIFVVRWELS